MLEYDAKGKRIVDLDLYYRKKKVEWSEIGKSKSSRESVGAELRKDYFSRITPQVYRRLLKLEEDLEKSVTG